MINFIRRLILKYGFGKRVAQVGFEPGSDNWKDAEFFTIHRAKTERLASIARERDALKDKLATARKQKKARRHLYAALETLKREEMQLAGDVR